MRVLNIESYNEEKWHLIVGRMIIIDCNSDEYMVKSFSVRWKNQPPIILSPYAEDIIWEGILIIWSDFSSFTMAEWRRIRQYVNQRDRLKRDLNR